MPPKKAKAAAKARAAARNSTRSNSTAAPPTVVTNRGKEYDTTAAATRNTAGAKWDATAAATRARRATTQTSAAPDNATAKSEFICRNLSWPLYSSLTRNHSNREHSDTYKEAR